MSDRPKVDVGNAAGAPTPAAPLKRQMPDSSGTVRARSRTTKDPGMLDLVQETLDPNKHYRWVRARSDEYNQSITKHKLKGYELETTDGGVKTVVEPDSRPDHAIAIGDLVLMSCPREAHAARQDEILRRNEQRLNATSAQTEEMAKKKGISIIKDADHDKEQQEIR